MKTAKGLMSEAVERHGLDGSKVMRVFFDGACEPVNPGGVATCGWIIYGGDDEIVADDAEFVREGDGATNNVAEYHALGRALRWLVDNQQSLDGIGQLKIFGDSQLVCKQVDGSWKCNKDHLLKLRDRCRELLAELRTKVEVEIRWIPREENEAADSLSRTAYESHTGKSFPERRR